MDAMKKYFQARWARVFCGEERASLASMRFVWCAFLALLWLPLVAQLTGFPPTAGLSENRNPAPLPKFNPYDPRTFTAGFDRWYGDHFGLRPFYVFANNWMTARILRTSPNAEVQFGSEGWFFFTADRSTENARGLIPFTEAELGGVVRRLEDQSDRMKRRGIPYYVLVCPNKQSIYPELLPAWMTKSGPTRLEQLVSALEKRTDIALVDPRREIIAGKTRGPVYMRTDSHWNPWGALIGHTLLTDAMRGRLQTLPRFLPGEWGIQVVHGGGGGDLTSSLLGLPGAFSDDWVSVNPPPGVQLRPARLKVVVFHDSFITQWKPFLDASFSEVVLQHRGVRGLDDALVDKEKPDVVIYEVVERNLDVFLHPSLR